MSRVALQDTITSPSTGVAVPSATITIRDVDEEGTLSTVYTTRAGATEASNPITTGDTGFDANGFLSIWLEPGLYWVEVDTGGATRAYEVDAVGYRVKLENLANLAGGANQLPYFDGENSMAQTPLTSYARTLLDDANQGAAQTTLGLVPTASPTDTTAGRLVKVGDFGLGEASSCPTIEDMNNASLASGLYRITAATANRPFDLGTVIIVRNGPNRVIQLVQQVLAGTNSPSTAIRHYFDGTWSAWGTLYHNGNVLGTVSQTGGVPTGAIIERGSNVNGEYVRFADGTQMCLCFSGSNQTSNQAIGSIFRGAADIDLTYPVTFAASPHVISVSRYVSGSASWGVAADVGATDGIAIRLYSAVTGAVGKPGVLAIGRWF